MDSEAKLTQLKSLLNEVYDLNSAGLLLQWDQETYMPPEGTDGRGYQLSTLSRIQHLKFTSPEVGGLLEDLSSYASELDPDSDDARLIKVTDRLYQKKRRVPADLVASFAKATSDAVHVWKQARAEANFAAFRPHLEVIFALRREYADCFAPFDHVYDPLLDDYEPGLKTADVKEIFGALRSRQVHLIRAITDRPQVDDSFLHQPFEEERQWKFGVEVITRFGYDWERGRQDKSTHPFTIGMGVGDVRITTRFLPNYFASALFSTTHEGGHALYEMGIDPRFSRTPLGQYASMGIHESQSRLYENVVSRSRPFWTYFYPRLQEYFPEQLGNVPLEAFYRAINKVEPSLIRVEADEATYNLHPMLRLELEIALMEGSLAVKDLPEAWNSAMQNYLGLTPPDDAQGVLQDIHWADGYIGYFSTYALGNLIAAQLWERATADIPDLQDQFERGEFTDLTAWLRSRVHCYGAKYEPQELVERVTGSKIDPEPYLRYLTQKYQDIYGFSV
jgi:carboxypeptidase Taq